MATEVTIAREGTAKPLNSARRGSDRGSRMGNYQRYLQYVKDHHYIDVEFDPNTGGLKATHEAHNFDEVGGAYEKEAQEAGYKAGHTVVFDAEGGGRIGQRYTEGKWDWKHFEVSGCETATSNNILHGLSHCASKRTTKVAVLVFPNGGYRESEMLRSIRRFKGTEKLNTKQYVKFEKVICVQNKRIIAEFGF